MSELLQVGVSNENVLDVQDRLLFLRHYAGHVDGTYTTAVEAAVQQFQQAIGAVPTGTLDEAGLDQLREHSNAHGYGHPSSHGHHRSPGHQHGPAEPPLTAAQWSITEAQLHGAPTLAVEPDAAIVADRGGNWHRDLRQTLQNASTRALVHAAANDQAVATACQAFRTQYAAAKLHELDGRVTLEDVGKQVVRSLMDVVGIRVCGTLASGTAKWFAEQLSVGVARKMSSTTKSVLSTEGTGRLLTHEFDAMITRAQIAAAVFHDAAAEVLAATFEPIYAKLDARVPLSEDDTAWVSQFFDTSDAQLDDAIERVFAIPGPQQRQALEVAVYQQLVEDFTELYLAQTEASRLFPDRRTAAEEYEHDPARRARQIAREQGAAFRQQLEQ